MSENSNGASIGGSGNKSTYTSYTGLASVRVRAINPTNKDYERITGKELPFDLKYDKETVDKGAATEITSMPIRFLVYEPISDNYYFFTFFLANKPLSTKAGDKFKFIDKLGSMSYYITNAEDIVEKYKFDKPSARKMMKGEDIYTAFMQKLIGYKSTAPGANWLADTTALGITPKDIYSGKTEKLNEYLQEVYDNDWSIVLLFSIREKEGKYYQMIESNIDLMWGNQGDDIANGIYLSLRTQYEEAKKAGRSLTQGLFTYKFQAFNKEECANYVAPNEDDFTPVTEGSTSEAVTLETSRAEPEASDEPDFINKEYSDVDKDQWT